MEMYRLKIETVIYKERPQKTKITLKTAFLCMTYKFSRTIFLPMDNNEANWSFGLSEEW